MHVQPTGCFKKTERRKSQDTYALVYDIWYTLKKAHIGIARKKHTKDKPLAIHLESKLVLAKLFVLNLLDR